MQARWEKKKKTGKVMLQLNKSEIKSCSIKMMNKNKYSSDTEYINMEKCSVSLRLHLRGSQVFCNTLWATYKMIILPRP